MWLKRDDCSGLALGGNKTRKLEFLLGRALDEGADGVVTFGALQSNHARQTGPTTETWPSSTPAAPRPLRLRPRVSAVMRRRVRRSPQRERSGRDQR